VCVCPATAGTICSKPELPAESVSTSWLPSNGVPAIPPDWISMPAPDVVVQPGICRNMLKPGDGTTGLSKPPLMSRLTWALAPCAISDNAAIGMTCRNRMPDFLH